MICERCLSPAELGNHGQGICPLEPREAGFQTFKDQLYNFTDYHSTGKPIVIHSKKQWKSHLKKNGLTDNFTRTKGGASTQPLDPAFRHRLRKVVGKAIGETKKKPFCAFGKFKNVSQVKAQLRKERIYASHRNAA